MERKQWKLLACIYAPLKTACDGIDHYIMHLRLFFWQSYTCILLLLWSVPYSSCVPVMPLFIAKSAWPHYFLEVFQHLLIFFIYTPLAISHSAIFVPFYNVTALLFYYLLQFYDILRIFMSLSHSTFSRFFDLSGITLWRSWKKSEMLIASSLHSIMQ